MPIPIVINGKACTTQAGQTVLGLLGELRLDPSRVAVELNRAIVKQPLWPATEIPPGAQIEIVQFVGGG